MNRRSRCCVSVVVEDEQERTAASCDGYRRLGHRLPEFGIVPEEDARPAAFQRLQPVKRGHHRLLIVHVARQAALAQGLAKVTGVRREHGSGSPKALPTKRPGAASASWKLGATSP